ncbi:hypothetical protein AVEN_211613-1 [Araneus ventricosus]|uniref:Cyclic nucleotide-binding domain-containing protein n=1 Tax=Araneus ventricosus TaxID=182803 RepID=A0A4Y2CKE9_ARAVE|nr:hypothetical protein AVEN_269228-1 [Araneus ventricosus]GBM04208.1 hypothetical protein AVEN_211613-1 [Araneus ventricosus]
MAEKLPEDVIPASSFNVSDGLFCGISLQLRGMLTQESKHLLTLTHEKRDRNAIFKAIAELEDIDFFQKFSTDTKFKLVEKMVFVVHEADEFLFRQGDPPESVYLILSGVVSLRYNVCESSNANSRTRWPEKVLRRGDVFGEIDLLLNRPSSVDAYAVGYSELLKIEKEDFGLIGSYLEEDIARLRSYLRGCEPLVGFNWSQEEWEVLEIFSELRSYLEEVEIYNGDQGSKVRWSYFVVSGECKLCRDIAYSASEASFGSKLSTNIKYLEDSNSKFLKKNVEFETCKQGFFFGVGENFGKNKVLTTPAMECLLVFRLVLVFKDKELLLQMARDLENSLPSDEVVSRYFIDYNKASQDVEELIKDILKDKPWRLLSSENSKQEPRFIKYV